MSNSIKIAVLGAGYMGQNHVKIFSSLPDVNLVAVCDINRQKTKKLAKQYKIKGSDDFHTLLQNENFDAVSICLPTSLHFESTIECLKRRIAVFVEKPICETVIKAKKLITLAKKNKVPLMVGHIERFNPVVNEIKLRIKSGELGKIIKIHTQRFSPPITSQQDVSVIVDLATHDIDVMKYIVDDELVRIYAETTHKMNQKEDLMSAILRFKNGTIGVLESSWLYPNKIRRLSILGENGVYQANYITQELYFYRQNSRLFEGNFDHIAAFTKADVVKIAFESKEPLYLELKAFIDALKSNSRMPVTAEDGLFALEIAENLAKSGASNKVLNYQ